MNETIEERIERLEQFIGDIEKIQTLYANSLREICDKYLNLLYIEVPLENHKNILMVDGFLSEISLESLPRNIIFNVRASHTFEYEGSTTESKIRFQRGNTYIDLPLKKFDVLEAGSLRFLEEGDYVNGIVYSLYINSQGIAIMSPSDSGAAALQEVQTIYQRLDDISASLTNLGSDQSITQASIGTGTVANLTVSNNLNLMNSVSLPTGSTCSTPNANSQIANKEYVDNKIQAELTSWYDRYHIFDTVSPQQALANAENKAVYFKYSG